jgi:putative tryptophan/tyrosine transport system substrate-binding protein
MRLIGLAVVLILGLPLAPLAVEVDAQEPTPRASAKIPLVGVLHPGVADQKAPAIFALQEGLRELGYVDGRNITLAYRWGGGKPETLPDLAADLVRLKVDVLFANGPQAIRASMGASRTIPIVGNDLESDPVESGYVGSFARPGGNITGFFLDLPDLTGKWLQLIREVVPATRRVAVLWDSTTSPHQLRALKAAAQAAAIELVVLEVRSPAQYEDALRTAMGGRNPALVQFSSPLIRQASRRVAEFSVKNRLPAISMFREFPEGGGLMSYGPELLVFFQRSAIYVDRILKGAKPADLPVEQPTKFELAINLKTAKTLGLTIPQTLLQRADQVIE